MERIPNDYKDESWTKMSTAVEQKLGIPPGLLTTIVQHGEKSNNDQVSEKGARTPFQIIPETRKAVLDKYGVDAYLSPENAAEAAGLLLKESLDRNKGNPAVAVAEYHGGTDRSNWGPRTKSYVARVMANLPQGEQPDPLAATPEEQSTFDQALAERKAQPAASSQIKQIYDAYVTGQMNDQEKADFEADVRDGKIMLPQGASIGGTKQEIPTDVPELPKEVVDAYTADNVMTRQEKIDLENDVKNGLVKLPAGVQLQNTEHLDTTGAIKEAVTGHERMTPEMESLPDIGALPEWQLSGDTLGSKEEFKKSLASAAGTLLANPDESVKILKSIYPDMGVRQDEKGNYIVKSTLDGKEYAIKPGFRASDIPRAIGTAIAFTPAGKLEGPVMQGLGAAGTQAIIETTQAAAGGEFNPGEVAAAGTLGFAAPLTMQGAKAVAKPITDAAKTALGRGAAPVVQAAETAVQQADNLPPAAAVIPEPVVPMAPQELTQTAKTAAEGGLGSGKAVETLAQQAAPDQKIVDAAKRLGIEDYLQPDHVTTNQAYRELSQAIKSVPGSQARAVELEGLQNVAKKADDIVTQLGGTDDLSQVSKNTKAALQSTQQELEAKANGLYSQLREMVPAKAPAPADNVLTFIKQRADDLGGTENLSPTERMILKKLSPKSGEPNLTANYKQLPDHSDFTKVLDEFNTNGIVENSEFSRDLRGGRAMAWKLAENADRVASLTKTLAESKTKVPLTLYRGVNDTKFIKNLKVGEEFTDDAFTSASLSPKSAFIKETEGDGGTIIKINAPEGAPIAPIKATGYYSDELEALVQRGARFKISSIEKGATKSGGDIITVDLVGVNPRRDILSTAAKDASDAERIKLSQLLPDVPEQVFKQPITMRQPTYTLLDDVRRDLTAARIKGAGPFKDADSGLIKKLESELKKDQKLVAAQHGAEDIFNEAQMAVAVRKGIEDDLVSLFGKQMDNSFAPKLTAAVKALPAGDSQKLVKLIQSVPEDMRQNVVASGISTAFGKSAKNGDISFPAYANWYEGLLRNKQSHAAVMSNLPAGSRKRLSDLYRVSKGISSASKERIATGRIQAIKEEFQSADSLMGNIYSLAKRSAGGLAAEAVTTSAGLPGAGLSAGIASALTKGKPNVLKAADTLIASPEFMEAVKASAAGNNKLAARKLSLSKPFIRFARALKNPPEMTNKERWIINALQVERNMSSDKERL